MLLYRPYTKLEVEGNSIFHDAVATLNDAIAYLKKLGAKGKVFKSWIEREDWPTLSRTQYLRHRIFGTDRGFGVSFQDKHKVYPETTKIIWPDLAVLDDQADLLLSELQTCSAEILVASPRHSGSYKCEVKIKAKDLKPFAADTRDSTFGGSLESKVARTAFPIWLDNANHSDLTVASLPLIFFPIIDDYVLNFIKKGQAKVICLACAALVDNIELERRNERSIAEHVEWTSSWKCSHGHRLYTHDQQIKIL